MFVRWVGGKQKIASQLATLAPKKYLMYHEPFLGVGSLYFHMKPKYAELSDMCDDIICAFEALRSNVIDVLRGLRHLYRKYEEDEQYYFRVRKWMPENRFLKGIRFIFLAHQSFNGLWRVNSKGQFNVPPGDTIRKFNYMKIHKAGSILMHCKRAVIKTQSYEECFPSKGSFVYLDPPYAGEYNQYTAHKFDEHDQVRLALYCERINSFGAKFLMTNSIYVKGLYSNFDVKTMETHSSVAQSPNDRGNKNILVIKNYL